MNEFQRKKKIRKWMYSRLSVLVLLLLLAVTAKGAYNVFAKERESRMLLARAEKNLEELSKRETFLKSEISRLETKEGMESEIRSQYQVTKPGEKMVVLIEEKTENKRDSLEVSFFERLKSVFK